MHVSGVSRRVAEVFGFGAVRVRVRSREQRDWRVGDVERERDA
jgi:hypothetical protein